MVYLGEKFSVFSFQCSVFSVHKNSIARSVLHAMERTMPHTHLSPSKSRRDLAATLRGSRTRKHARLRHRLLQAERLEDRRLLAYADFELSSLLPANGGDGTSGFVSMGSRITGGWHRQPAAMHHWATSVATASRTLSSRKASFLEVVGTWWHSIWPTANKTGILGFLFSTPHLTARGDS